MRTTIDKAGRIVIPKVLRDRVGLASGEVEITETGAGLMIEPAGERGRLVNDDGWLSLPPSGEPLDPDVIQDVIDLGRSRGLEWI